MAGVRHEEWTIHESENDADQATLTYRDPTLPEAERTDVKIDPLDDEELEALRDALEAYLLLKGRGRER